MDEKGIKKILQIIEVILKLKEEDKLSDQGFNDRIGVAKEIYERNKSDNHFVVALNKSVKEDGLELFKLIKE